MLTSQSGAAARRLRSVLVVDQDIRTLEAVARVASDLGSVARRAQSPEAAVEVAKLHPPAALVSSIETDGSAHGVSLGRVMRQRFGSAVIFVGPHIPPQHIVAVAAFQPEGFVCKPLRHEQLDATLRLALRRPSSGGPSAGLLANGASAPNDPDLARALRQIAAVISATGVVGLGPGPGALCDNVVASLRPREQEIVRLLFEHCRVPAIANRLGISTQTVRNHLKHVFQTLGVHSQQELIAFLQESTSTSVPRSA
jgi:DNA-binding NarL/FixJ family response regulator